MSHKGSGLLSIVGEAIIWEGGVRNFMSALAFGTAARVNGQAHTVQCFGLRVARDTVVVDVLSGVLAFIKSRCKRVDWM